MEEQYKQRLGNGTSKTENDKQAALQRIIDSSQHRARAEVRESTAAVEAAAQQQAFAFEEALQQKMNLEMHACRMKAEFS
eukprot:11267078-Prorocentrum_lima.AAC.1